MFLEYQQVDQAVKIVKSQDITLLSLYLIIFIIASHSFYEKKLSALELLNPIFAWHYFNNRHHKIDPVKIKSKGSKGSKLKKVCNISFMYLLFSRTAHALPRYPHWL